MMIYNIKVPFTQRKEYAQKVFLVAIISFAFVFIFSNIFLLFDQCEMFVDDYYWLILIFGLFFYVYNIALVIVSISFATTFPLIFSGLVTYIIGLTLVICCFSLQIKSSINWFLLMILTVLIVLYIFIRMGETGRSTRNSSIIGCIIIFSINILLYLIITDSSWVGICFFLIIVLISKLSILQALLRIYNSKNLDDKTYIKEVMLIYLRLFLSPLQIKFE